MLCPRIFSRKGQCPRHGEGASFPTASSPRFPAFSSITRRSRLALGHPAMPVPLPKSSFLCRRNGWLVNLPQTPAAGPGPSFFPLFRRFSEHRARSARPVSVNRAARNARGHVAARRERHRYGGLAVATGTGKAEQGRGGIFPCVDASRGGQPDRARQVPALCNCARHSCSNPQRSYSGEHSAAGAIRSLTAGTHTQTPYSGTHPCARTFTLQQIHRQWWR